MVLVLLGGNLFSFWSDTLIPSVARVKYKVCASLARWILKTQGRPEIHTGCTRNIHTNPQELPGLGWTFREWTLSTACSILQLKWKVIIFPKYSWTKIIVLSHKTKGPRTTATTFIFKHSCLPTTENKAGHFMRYHQMHLKPQWIQGLIRCDISGGVLHFCKNKIPLIKISHLTEAHETDYLVQSEPSIWQKVYKPQDNLRGTWPRLQVRGSIQSPRCLPGGLFPAWCQQL